MVDEKCQPGLAADNFTGTGPGGLDPIAFAKWYRDAELEQWRNFDFEAIGQIAELLEKAEQNNAQVFVMGNGGSAATASHIATDWSKTAERPNAPMLRCTSLNDNVALMTAIGNDLGLRPEFGSRLLAIDPDVFGSVRHRLSLSHVFWCARHPAPVLVLTS